MDNSSTEPRQLQLFTGSILAMFAVILIYSQTQAFAWDEGFHLLAAQLIKAGKRPYLDFCFPQTPLNAYLNAAWMTWFGESWRPIHALAAFWVAAAAFLTGHFVLKNLPYPNWRLPAAIAAAAAVAMNSQVLLFGTLGQAYGICLFLTVAAFRLTVVGVERRSAVWAVAAGGMAGAAAASSLLTAAVAPVLALWILLRNRAGNRWAKLVGYAAGGAIPFIPIALLYRQGPQQVLFNIYQYQVKYRSVKWEGATGQDISTLTSWIDSAQGLSLAVLGMAGIWLFVRNRHAGKTWQGFHLSAAVALALLLELSTAHPTFERYFLEVVPFLVLPAIAGLVAVGDQMALGDRPWLPALLFICITALGMGKALWEDHDSYHWQDCEKIARQVDQVTPRGGSLWADELFYFLTRRPPPDGMEFSYAHDLELPADKAALFHILRVETIHDRVRAGEFATVAACYESDRTEKLNLTALYRQKSEIRDCPVYWNFAK